PAGATRLAYSGDPAAGDLAAGASAQILQNYLGSATGIPALIGNVQVLGVPGNTTGPFLVRFINNLGRMDVGSLSFVPRLADGVLNAGTVFTATSGSASFAGAGDGFPGPGLTFTAGSSPTLADLQFYLNGIASITSGALNQGNVFLEGAGGTGPFTVTYPQGKLIDPIKVFTAPAVAGGSPATAIAPL